MFRSRTKFSRPAGSPRIRLQVEALEDRSVPALIADPVGDFLPTYTGVPAPGLDVVAHEVALIEEQDRMVFYGKMAGSVADTQSVGGVYLIGVDRGQGTPRFLSSPNSPPEIGPNVVWDSLVILRPNGTGMFRDALLGVVTPLDPAGITINGDEFTVSVPLSQMLPNSTRPPAEWTYNLWPRNGIGNNVQVSDLAPDDGNSPVQTIAPAQVESVIVNDGAAQRSMVNRLTVTFDGPVTLDASAFQLTREDGSAVELAINTCMVDGNSVATLTFAALDVVGGSLADGSYTLTVRSDLILDRFGRALDGDGDGDAGGDRVDGFRRLFGDSDGDGDVDSLDRDCFGSAFGTAAPDAGYLWYFDFDGDGDVDGRDNGEFNRRFGQF
jgi:methionine-rich copper-binding protein CopC